MLALTLSERSLRLRRDHPMPEAAGEALIRVHLAGICATDLELTRGYMGFSGVLGHEWVGTVEAAADSSWVGARVVGDINCACGRCDSCQQGRPHHCAQRTVLGIVGRDGAFATHTRLPVGNLHRVPAGVPDEAAVFVEPLAAACRIVEQLHIRPSDRVLVLGLGRLGQLCARVLALTGASGMQNARLAQGDVVTASVTFDEPIFVQTSGGVPVLRLDIGGTLVQAVYDSGSGTTALTFKYTVQAGLNDVDGIAIPLNALLSNGATLRNAAGLDALLAHPAMGADPAYLVDTAAPSAPAILAVTDDVGNLQGDVAGGGSTDDTRPTVRIGLSGTGAEIGDTVQLRDGQVMDLPLAEPSVSAS